MVLIIQEKQNSLHSCFRGDVVTMECVEKIIKKDWCHPLTGETLKERDIILLQRVILLFIWVIQLCKIEKNQSPLLLINKLC
jgi:hypothetical protein